MSSDWQCVVSHTLQIAGDKMGKSGTGTGSGGILSQVQVVAVLKVYLSRVFPVDGLPSIAGNAKPEHVDD